MSLTIRDAIRTGQWGDLYYLLRETKHGAWRTWRTPFECPCCEADGSIYTGDFLDPPERCGFCDDEGVVSVRRRLVWLWDCQIMEWFRGN